MADIFGSSKHPSLFPMTVPFPVISQEDYLLFYKNERALFTVLLVVLHREVIQSIFMMGFLLWLEREGYTSKNLVQTIVNCFTADIIDQIADEVMICIKFLEKKANRLMFESSSKQYNIQTLQCFLDRKSIHLEELHHNFDEVSAMAKEVSSRAFDDILENFIRCGGPLVLHSTQEVTVCNVVGGFRYVGPVVPFPSYDVTKYVKFPRTPSQDAEFMLNNVIAHRFQQMGGVGEGESHGALLPAEIYLKQEINSSPNSLYTSDTTSLFVSEQEEEVPPENRTIFLTFSKGYPISENEVKLYFTRIFGDFIESIYMQPVAGENQPLFARIVARSPSMVRAVVERDGADGRSKYYINGKHVWARKFVRRPPPKDTAEGAVTSE
ncbi:unnamed protein product [Lactuca virosa]|uniref:RRM domain-containing protein n=1 Tax=Lactuca virosa TaxID=75947 RepID=A0AAU9MTA7_9ASTR|nr:unnamed protein product [Lactuca virosa]